MAGGRNRERLALVLISTCAVVAAAPVRAQEGVEADDSGLELELIDGEVKFELGGRLHLDAMTYDEEAFGTLDRADVRRARLELSGRIGERVRVRLDREFSDDGEWNNVWLSYEPADDVLLRGGQFIAPFSMEDLQSSNVTLFIERALPQALAPGYLVGGELRASGRRWNVAGGWFGEPIDGETDSRRTEGEGFAGRFTFTPYRDGDALIHLGAGLEWRTLDGDSDFRLRARPEASLAPERFVDTGTLRDVERFANLGLEAGWRDGPFMLQAQYMRLATEREGLEPDAAFEGWYAQGSWVVTGEQRRYSRSSGLFGAVTPKGRNGALELGARYSVLDLDNKDVRGGVQRDVTLGATLWMSSKMRLMAEYVHADADPDEDGEERDADLFQARLQIAF